MSTQNKNLFKIEKRDGSNWKRLLLTWINHCGFLRRSYYNIEQTNINEFFEKFRNHIKNWPNTEVTEIAQFLKVYYPAVELHTDDCNQISSSDYMYIYSVLLHFGCVKHPTEFFQKLCQDFHETHQEAIKTFFKGLLDKSDIDKALLRKMIAEASKQTGSIPAESPMKNPQNYKISPPTPKTHMLEEKNKELHSIKASLETEKYEKGFLEIQNKQLEDKIKKLEQDHRNYLSELHDLRLVAHARDNSDDCSANEKDCNNQQKLRLQKLINEKEDTIFKLKQNLDSLSEERDLAKEKLKYAQREVNLHRSKISDLEYERLNLMEEMQKKDLTIQNLTETKLELEEIINESRSPNGRFADLNNSLEYLDLSSSHNSNSSGSICSQENLGRTVVDIQLREKECENVSLKMEIEKLQNDNSKLSKYISELIRKHHEIFDICKDNLITDENAEDITHNFMIFENYFSQLVDNYNQANQSIKKLNGDKLTLNSQIINLNEKIFKLDELINDCRIIVQNNDLKGQTESNKNAGLKAELTHFIENINITLCSKNNKIEELINQNSKQLQLYSENLRAQNRFTVRIQSLTENLMAKCSAIDQIVNSNMQLKQRVDVLQSDLENYQIIVDDLENKNANLNRERTGLIAENQEKLKTIQQKEQKLNKLQSNFENSKLLNEKIRNECSALRTRIDEFDRQLQESLEDSKNKKVALDEVMQKNLSIVKEKEELMATVSHLNEEISEIRRDFSLKESHNSEQIEKLSKTLNERNLEYQNVEEKNINYLKTIDSLETIITDLKSKLKQLEAECSEMGNLKHDSECQNHELQKSLEELKRGLQSNADEANALKTQNESLIEDCGKKSKNIENFKNKIEEMDKNIKEQKLELEQLHSSLNGMQEVEKSLKEEKEKLAFELSKSIENSKMLEAKCMQIEESLNERSNECNELKNKLANSLEAERDLNSKNLKLRKSLDDTTEEVACIRNKIKEYEAQLTDQMTEIYRLEALTTSQTAATTELNSLLQQRIDEILNLQKAFDSLQEDNSEKESQLETVKEKLSYSEASLSKLEKENVEFSSTIESLTMFKMTTEDELEDLKSKLEAANKEQTRNDDNLNEITKQIENNIEIFLEADVLVDFLELSINSDSPKSRLRKAVNTLLNSNASMLRKNLDFEQKINDYNLELKNVSEFKSDLETQLQKNEIMRDNLAKCIEEQKVSIGCRDSEYSERISKAENKIKELEAEKSVLQDQNNRKREEIDLLSVTEGSLLKQISELEEAKLKNGQELNNLSNQISNLKEKVENYSKENENYLNEIADLKQSKNSINEHLQTERSNNEHLKKELFAIKNQVETITKEREELKTQLESMQEERNKQTIQMMKRNQEIENMQEKLYKLNTMIEKLQNEQTQLSEENSNIILERNSLSKQLQVKSEEIKELQNEVQSLTNQNNQIAEKIANLNAQIESNSLHMVKEASNKDLLQTQLEERLKELEESKNEVFQITSLNWELKCERDDLSKKLKAKISEMDEIRESVRAAAEKLQTENRTMAEAFNKVVIQAEKANTDLTNAAMRSCVLEKELQSKIQLLEQSLGQNAELIEKANAYRLKYEEKHNEFVCLNESVDKLRNENEALKALQTEHSSLSDKLLGALQESDKLKTDLNHAQTEKQNFIEHKQKLEEKMKNIEENLKETNSNLEKKSFRLGEEQAKSIKLEKECDVLRKTTHETKSKLENLQKDYIKLQNDCKSMRTKTIEHEKEIDSHKMQCQLLSNENANLISDLKSVTESQKALQIENDGLKLKQEDSDSNLQRLAKSLSEMAQVHEEIKKENSNLLKRNAHLEEQVSNLDRMVAEARTDPNESQIDCIRNLEIQLAEACEANSNLNDKLSKTSLQLEINNQALEGTKSELEKCSHDLNICEKENNKLGESNKEFKIKLEELESEKEHIICESKAESDSLKKKLENLEALLQQNEAKTKYYCKKVELLEMKSEDGSENLIELNKKLHLLEDAYNAEVTEAAKLKDDLSIFRAKLLKSRQKNDEDEKKWLEEKQSLEKTAEDKIKEIRNEMEGKLEKMKNKMKSLYNEEVTKLKKKYENDLFDYQADNQVLNGKCEKYNQHIKTLSKRVVTLNEKVCELERDNRFMECKLKDVEQYGRHSLRPQRPQSTMLTTAPVANFLGTNLRMEDEEGEIFNNTYLADVKDGIGGIGGRISDFGIRDSISVQELQYRNSLAPPHLRSTYLAQYKDNQLPEDEIKDGLASTGLDDSLTSLMSGHRKKLAGTTSYKKPGPPTPSKSGGRLSFGGSSEVHASILKEYNDNEQVKTPAKFKFFSSRSHAKDEKNIDVCSFVTPKIQKIRSSLGRKYSLHRPLAANFSSTPRKSKIHFDNRRELDKIINESKINRNNCDDEAREKHNEQKPKPSRVANQKENQENCVQLHCEKESHASKFTKWRSRKVIYTSESGTSDTNSPHIINNKQLESTQKSSDKDVETGEMIHGKIPKQKRRLSIYHRGNVYARSKLPSHMIKDQVRAKAKCERAKDFNRFRQSLNPKVQLRKSLLNACSFATTNDGQAAQQFSPESYSNISDGNNDTVTNIAIVRPARLSDICNKENLESIEFQNRRCDSIDPLDLFEMKMNQQYDNPSFSEIGIKENAPSVPFGSPTSKKSNHGGDDMFVGDGSESNPNASINHSSNSNITQITGSNRTLYASSNIISRKIPQINSTTVSRKSSFYFKNGQYLLIANEPLTFYDILKLWLKPKEFFKFKSLNHHIFFAVLFVVAAIVFYITL